MLSRVLRSGILRRTYLIQTVRPFVWRAVGIGRSYSFAVGAVANRFQPIPLIRFHSDAADLTPQAEIALNPEPPQLTFEDAVKRISGYEDRSLADNLLILIDCGRLSPGILPIQKKSSNKQIVRFIKYLNNNVTAESISSIPRPTLVRSMWSLPRLGYTYSSTSVAHQNSELINCLLHGILEDVDQLTSKDWSSLLKALGKLNYISTEEVHSRILQGIDHSRGSASLIELINICWGLLRIRVSERNSLKSENRGDVIVSHFFRDNRVFDVYQQLGTMIQNDPKLVQRLRPSQLSNLVYLLSYSRFSNRFVLLEQLASIINMSVHRCTMTEIATIFAAYAESGAPFPRLFRNIRKAWVQRLSEITPKTAVSLMYSLSRIWKGREKQRGEDLGIHEVMNIALEACDSLPIVDSLHLLTACNSFGIFPRESIDTMIGQMEPYLRQLSEDQSFVVLCTIVKSGIDSSSISLAYNELYDRYIRGYEQLEIKSGVTSNMLCLFLRYSFTHQKPADSCIDKIKTDFHQNPEFYNARAVSSIIYSLAHAKLPENAFLKELIVRFISYCLQRDAVTEYDIIFTLSSLKLRMHEKEIQQCFPPLGSAVVQWSFNHLSNLTPHFISFLLLVFPQIRMPANDLFRIFDLRFSNNLTDFCTSDIINVIKGLTIMKKGNPLLFEFLYKRVMDDLPSLSTIELLSVMWTIASRHVDQIKLYTLLKMEIEKRSLTASQQSNYHHLIDLYITNTKGKCPVFFIPFSILPYFLRIAKNTPAAASAAAPAQK